MPENTLYVGRPTKWCNPHRGSTPESLREQYSKGLHRGELGFTVGDVRRDLSGRNLACWCAMHQVCHADVLLAIASGDDAGCGPLPSDLEATGWI